MDPAISPGTVGGALIGTSQRLAGAGVPEARADAEVLLAHALGTSRAGIVAAARRPLPETASRLLARLVERRARREPVHHLVGEREFWSMPFAVDRRVLIPRPETELLVETVVALAPDARRVLDVGTGSGAIAAALARELRRTRLWASDIDRDALAVARQNLARHAPEVALVAADLVGGFRAATFDVVVSNPPYVGVSDWTSLAPEIRVYEPRRALLAGEDGLATLRALLMATPAVLVPGGWLVVEMGAGQADTLRRVAAEDGRWTDVRTVRDHAGIERVLAAKLKGDAWTRS